MKTKLPLALLGSLILGLGSAAAKPTAPGSAAGPAAAVALDAKPTSGVHRADKFDFIVRIGSGSHHRRGGYGHGCHPGYRGGYHAPRRGYGHHRRGGYGHGYHHGPRRGHGYGHYAGGHRRSPGYCR